MTRARPDLNEHGFQTANPMLEEYLTQPGTRWGVSGHLLKSHIKSGARSAADEFSRTRGSKINRAHFRMVLEGSGVNHGVAADIAEQTTVGEVVATFHQDRHGPVSTFTVR